MFGIAGVVVLENVILKDSDFANERRFYLTIFKCYLFSKDALYHLWLNLSNNSKEGVENDR